MAKPPVNSLSLEMCQEMCAALKEVESNEKVNALLLRSSSSNIFSAGLDINEMHHPDPARLADFWRSIQVSDLWCYDESPRWKFKKMVTEISFHGETCHFYHDLIIIFSLILSCFCVGVTPFVCVRCSKSSSICMEAGSLLLQQLRLTLQPEAVCWP